MNLALLRMNDGTLSGLLEDFSLCIETSAITLLVLNAGFDFFETEVVS